MSSHSSCTFCGVEAEDGSGLACPHCRRLSHYGCLGIPLKAGTHVPTTESQAFLNVRGLLVPCSQCSEEPKRFNVWRSGDWKSGEEILGCERPAMAASTGASPPRTPTFLAARISPVRSTPAHRVVGKAPGALGRGLNRLHAAPAPTAAAPIASPKLLTPTTRATGGLGGGKAALPATPAGTSGTSKLRTPHVLTRSSAKRLPTSAATPSHSLAMDTCPTDMVLNMTMENFSNVKEIETGPDATLLTGCFSGGHFKGKTAAIKRWERKVEDKEAMLKDLGIGKHAWHGRIVKVYGGFLDVMHCFLVMEFCGGGDLFSLILSRSKLSPAATLRIGGQIAHALEFLHAQKGGGVTHGAVRPEHVLLTHTLAVKLSDPEVHYARLGRRQPFQSTTPLSQHCGTAAFNAPECKLQPKSISHKADIWGLGMTVFAMIEGNLPYAPQVAEKNIAPTIAVRGLPAIPRLNPRLNKLLGQMLKPHVGQRLESVSAVLEDPEVKEAMKPMRVKVLSLETETGTEEESLAAIRSYVDTRRKVNRAVALDKKAMELLGRTPSLEKIYRGRYQVELDEMVYSLAPHSLSAPARAHLDANCGCVGGVEPCHRAWFLVLRMD